MDLHSFLDLVNTLVSKLGLDDDSNKTVIFACLAEVSKVLFMSKLEKADVEVARGTFVSILCKLVKFDELIGLLELLGHDLVPNHAELILQSYLGVQEMEESGESEESVTPEYCSFSKQKSAIFRKLASKLISKSNSSHANNSKFDSLFLKTVQSQNVQSKPSKISISFQKYIEIMKKSGEEDAKIEESEILEIRDELVENINKSITSKIIKTRVFGYKILAKLETEKLVPPIAVSAHETSNIKVAKLLNANIFHEKTRAELNKSMKTSLLDTSSIDLICGKNKLSGFTPLSTLSISAPRPNFALNRVFTNLPYPVIKSYLTKMKTEIDHHSERFIQFGNDFDEDENDADKQDILPEEQWHLKHITTLYDLPILKSIAIKMNNVGWPMKNKKVFDEVWSLLLRVLVSLTSEESSDVRQCLDDIDQFANILIQILTIQANQAGFKKERLIGPKNKKSQIFQNLHVFNLEDNHNVLGFGEEEEGVPGSTVYRVGQVSIQREIWSNHGITPDPKFSRQNLKNPGNHGNHGNTGNHPESVQNADTIRQLTCMHTLSDLFQNYTEMDINKTEIFSTLLSISDCCEEREVHEWILSVALSERDCTGWFCKMCHINAHK